MQQLVLNLRWPALILLAVGSLLLLWRLLAPRLEPRAMLRWARGRVEQALVPLVGSSGAPGVADTALISGGGTLLLAAVLLFAAVGPTGFLLAPPLALLAGWWIADRQAGRRRERLSEQVYGLAQALAAGLAGNQGTGTTVFTLLRRHYRTLAPPLQDELRFMELVLRGQADLGEVLACAADEAVEKHLRSLLALLNTIYRESLDVPAQRRALGTFLERLRQDEQVRRTVRIESRFGQSSQTIVLLLIPAFVVLSAIATSMLGAEISVVEFYLRTTPGRMIALGVMVVEGLVAWVSRRMVQRVQWE